MHFLVDDPAVDDDVRGIAGHVDYLQALAQRGQPLEHFLAVLIGHDHVGEQQIDAARVAGRELEAALGAVRFDHLVAHPAQQLADRHAHHLIVFQDQNGLALPGRERETGDPRAREGGFAQSRGAGQVDLEGAPLAELRMDQDDSGVLLDDAVNHRQAQAAACAPLLGGEERLEESLLRLLVEAGAGVANREHGVPAGPESLVRPRELLVDIHVPACDGEQPAARHGVARVDGEVEQHLFELARVGEHQLQIRRHGNLEADILPDRSSQHGLESGYDVAQLGGPQLEHLLAPERQQLLGQPLEVLGGVLDIGQHLFHLRRELATEQDLAIGEDGREQVVEVVRDAARQQADALQLLHLPELLVEALALGEIADDADDALAAAFVDEQRLLGAEGVRHALGIGERLLVDVGSAGVQHLLVPGPEDVGLALGEQVVIRLAEHFMPLAPDEVAARAVHQYEAMLRVLDEERISNRVDDLVQVALGP